MTRRSRPGRPPVPPVKLTITLGRHSLKLTRPEAEHLLALLACVEPDAGEVGIARPTGTPLTVTAGDAVQARRQLQAALRKGER